MVTRSEIIEATREIVHVKWKHQGRTIAAGIDCYGVIAWPCVRFGLPHYLRTNYPRTPQGVDFKRVFDENMVRVPLVKARDADVVVFSQIKYPCHCGILTTKNGQTHIIHSTASHRMVVEERYDQRMLDHVRGKPLMAYSFPGVTD